MSIFQDVKNPHVIEEWVGYLRTAMGGKTFQVESSFATGDKTYHREASFSPIKNGKEIIGVTCYSKDTTDNKQKEARLMEQDLLFRSLLEKSRDGIVMVGVHGSLKYISPSVNRILGYVVDEMPDFWELIYPDDRPMLKAMTDDLEPRCGESANVVCRVLTKQNRVRWIQCTFTNLLHEPSIMAFVGNYEDITERRDLEFTLENTIYDLIDADERQSAIINSLGANIALLNGNGDIVEVNGAWKQFAFDNQLVSSNFCVGENYLDITLKAAEKGDEIAQAAATGIKEVLDGKIAEFSMEYPCHSSTEKRWFKMIVYPLYKKLRKGVVAYHVDITDRKLADMQIDFHRRNRDALINSTTDLMWSLDADMRLITANNAFLSAIKMTSNVDLMPGDSLLMAISYSEEEVAYWTEKYSRVMAGEQFMEVVHRHNPLEFWAEISFHPIWENGKVIGAACYSRDITERKRAEQLIMQNQQMMAEAESIAHFGSWELDLGNQQVTLENPLRWSDEVSRIFGYEPGQYEVTNENFFKAVHPDDREPIRQAVQKAISENVNYALQHRVLRPDGEIRWVLEAAKIVVNEATGKPVKMIGTVLDITDRKASEEKLREAERNYREIFDKASDAIFVHEVETGLVIDVNNKACEIIGCTKEEILYGDPAAFVAGTPGSTVEDAMLYLQKSITEGPQLFEFHSKRMNGTVYWNEVNLSLATIAGTERILAFFRNIDDRKNAEENLRNSEARYRQIVETAQEGIWILDENNRTTYVNNKMCEILEYAREEMLGKQNYDFMNEEMKQEAMLAIERRRSGISEHYDLQYITKTGRHIWASLSASPLQTADGKYKGALAMITDITDRKLAEESVRLSNERYELATKATNDAVWDWNLLTNEVYWSEGFVKLFGYERSETAFNLESWTKRIHPEDVDSVYSSIHKEINDPSTNYWQYDYRYIKSDGSIAYVHDRGYILHDEEGTPIRMVGAMQDITSQKLAEESVHKSEANLRTVFDYADRSYVLLDKNFNILAFNSVANEYAKLFYNNEFVEGHSLISYLKPEARAKGKRIFESVLAGHVFDHEVNIQMHDKTEKWFRVKRYPVRGKNGEIIGVCISTKDSTKRKNFEIDRDKMTAEIVQRNLDLEQYAYIVSHNLRAPVANIIGFADALLHPDFDEDEKLEMLNGLDVSIKKLDTVILDLNGILQVKKHVDFPMEFVRLSTLVNDISLSIDNTIKRENAVILTNFSEIGEIFTNKSYLHSIFFNLISNSIKYRKKNVAPLIEIESRRINGDKIELIFKDNGLGIDLHKKKGMLFGLYKRFHPEAADGKGLGLFMVKTQVENLGGKITVESEQNVGTVFKIIFDIKTDNKLTN